MKVKKTITINRYAIFVLIPNLEHGVLCRASARSTHSRQRAGLCTLLVVFCSPTRPPPSSVSVQAPGEPALAGEAWPQGLFPVVSNEGLPRGSLKEGTRVTLSGPRANESATRGRRGASQMLPRGHVADQMLTPAHTCGEPFWLGLAGARCAPTQRLADPTG